MIQRAELAENPLKLFKLLCIKKGHTIVKERFIELTPVVVKSKGVGFLQKSILVLTRSQSSVT